MLPLLAFPMENAPTLKTIPNKSKPSFFIDLNNRFFNDKKSIWLIKAFIGNQGETPYNQRRQTIKNQRLSPSSSLKSRGKL